MVLGVLPNMTKILVNAYEKINRLTKQGLTQLHLGVESAK